MYSIKLSTCPECNNKPELVHSHYGKNFQKQCFQVICNNCGIKSKQYEAQNTAIRNWNKRKDIDVSGYYLPENEALAVRETTKASIISIMNKGIIHNNTLNSNSKEIKKGVKKMSKDIKNEKKSNVPAVIPAKGQISIATQEIDVFKMADTLAKSGYFSEARDAAKCVVKIMAGMELGFGPIASMTGVYISQSGKPCLHANMMAARIKTAPGYDYIIKKMDDNICEVVITRNGTEMNPTISFSINDAKKAGLLQKSGPNPWLKYPRNMLFARAISNAAKWHCPELFSGVTAYTPEELDMPVNEDGEPIPDAEIVNQQTTESVKKPVKQKQKKVSKVSKPDEKLITKKDVNLIRKRIKDYQIDFDRIQQWMNNTLGIRTFSDLTQTLHKSLINKIDQIAECNQVLEIEIENIDRELKTLCESAKTSSFKDRMLDYIFRAAKCKDFYDLDEKWCTIIKGKLGEFKQKVIDEIDFQRSMNN